MTDTDIEQTLVALLSGESISALQQRRLDAWLAADPANRRRLDEMRATWRLLGRRRFDAPPFEPIDEDVLRRAAARGAEPRRDPRRRRIAAAAAAGLAAAALLLVVLRPDRAQRSVAGVVHATAAGEMANVRLEDGTIATLAPGSRIVVAPASGGRELTLEGEAFFAVVSDSAHPFRIHTAQGDVRVLGTRFDVRVGDAALDLVVVDGRVELSRERRAVHVTGGEVGRIERGVVLPASRVDDVFALLPWMKGTMVFNGTSLANVAIELERRYHTRVELAPSLAGETVTAVLSDRPLAEVVAIVCGLVDASCRVADGGRRVVVGAGAP